MLLKEKKLDYQRSCEEYIEQKKLYETFEDMMKSLIMHKPKDPVKFLIDKLQTSEMTRIVLVGPPGSKRKEIALWLSETLSDEGSKFECISVGDLINKEISKRSEYGKEIEASRRNYAYVPDEIVIKLVRSQVDLMEQDQKSWIIEGFPRTEVQAVALQKMGIIPEKFIMLNQSSEETFEKVKEKLSGNDQDYIIQCKDDPKRLEQLARNAVLEYNLQISGVKKICQGTVTELAANEDHQTVLEEIVRILKLKDTKAPRRPQRVILMGSPGSKKENYALQISEKYQLVYVQVSQLIKEVMRRNGDNDYARQLKSYIAQDRIVPDDVVIDLVQDRLSKPDCRLNGWILDGCPFNMNQIKLLIELKIEPQKVIALEISDEAVLQEVSNLKVHEQSGKLFTPAEAEAADEGIRSQLTPRNMQVVHKEVNEYREFLQAAEAEFSDCLVRIDAEEGADKVFLSFCDAIENSL